MSSLYSSLSSYCRRQHLIIIGLPRLQHSPLLLMVFFSSPNAVFRQHIKHRHVNKPQRRRRTHDTALQHSLMMRFIIMSSSATTTAASMARRTPHERHADIMQQRQVEPIVHSALGCCGTRPPPALVLFTITIECTREQYKGHRFRIRQRQSY